MEYPALLTVSVTGADVSTHDIFEVDQESILVPRKFQNQSLHSQSRQDMINQ